MKISALIFSMNRIENVIKLAKLIKDYVDEIVIIDSSSRRNFEILKRKLKFAKIYWLPPIGMADLYYQIGINLCSHDWILQFDDDEEPSPELMHEILKFKNRNEPSAKVFFIKRIGMKGFLMLCRFFNRKYVEPTGVIHWGYKIKTADISKLSGYIIHHCEYEYQNIDKVIKKLKQYAIIEAYQWWYKVRYSLMCSKSPIIKSIYKNFLIKNPLFIWILANAYLLYHLLSLIRRRFIFLGILYSIFILVEINKNFKKYIKIWKYMDKTPIKLLRLNTIEDVKRWTLHPENGIRNFIKIMESIFNNRPE